MRRTDSIQSAAPGAQPSTCERTIKFKLPAEEHMYSGVSLRMNCDGRAVRKRPRFLTEHENGVGLCAAAVGACKGEQAGRVSEWPSKDEGRRERHVWHR
jgi:hypothetical protein